MGKAGSIRLKLLDEGPERCRDCNKSIATNDIAPSDDELISPQGCNSRGYTPEEKMTPGLLLIRDPTGVSRQEFVPL